MNLKFEFKKMATQVFDKELKLNQEGAEFEDQKTEEDDQIPTQNSA